MVRFNRADARGEKWAFFIALIAGGGIIIALRLYGLPDAPKDMDASVHWTAWAAIFVAIATIVGYAFYAWHTPQSGVSIDQAADNAYYLGLVFTLLSLVFALLQVQDLLDDRTHDSATRPQLVLDLLPDFGLALVSTIAGIIARVVLQQFRGSIEEAEERAQFELSHATAEFRDKLYVAVGDFTNAARAATDVVNEIPVHMQTTLKAAAESTAEAVREIGKQIGRAGAEFATGATTATRHMQEFAEQSDGAMQKLQAQSEAAIEGWREQHAAALNHLTEWLREQTAFTDADSAQIRENLAALGDHATEAKTKIVQLAEAGETFTRTLIELNNTMQNATKHAAEQVASAGQLLEQTKTAVADSAHTGKNLATLGDHAAEAQTKIAQLAEASETFTHAFTELNRALQDATKHTAKQAGSTSSHQRKWKWRFWRRQN